MEKSKKAPSFIKNVVLIVLAQISIKILGVIYRVVTTNIEGFGDAGNGFYNYGFQIYTLLLAISSIGIPNAISKLVAERCAHDDFKGAIRIFRTALVLFFGIGLFFSGLMFFGAGFIADKIIDEPLAVYTMRVLSPAIVFVSVSSVIRGFFAGQQNMKATNTSQVLEQLLKCISTVLIVLSMTNSEPHIMAAGATLATTISTILSFLYLCIFYLSNKKDIKEKYISAPALKLNGKAKSVAKTILLVSIPISLSAVVASLNRIIDLVTINRCLKFAIKNGAVLGKEITELQGILAKTDVLVNLPLALNTAFSTVLVPTIASALVLKDYDTAKEKTSFSLLVSSIIALPCTLGYMALSGPILETIYYNAKDGALLFTLVAPTVFFSAMTQTISGALQGMGKIYIPALSMLIGGLFKVIINLILIPIPEINIIGAPIGSIVCQATTFFICFFVLQKNLPMKLGIMKYFAKPFASSIIMGGCVLGCYKFMSLFAGNAVSTIISIIFGAVVYFALVLILKVFSREELASLPFIGKKFK